MPHRCGDSSFVADTCSSLPPQNDTEGWNLVVAVVAVAAIAVLVVPSFSRA